MTVALQDVQRGSDLKLEWENVHIPLQQSYRLIMNVNYLRKFAVI